jgi:CRISPR-associated protein Cst1
MNDNHITLYPSNWLYNAGVVGLLDVQESAKENVRESLAVDGSYHLSTDYFNAVKVGTQKLAKAIVCLTNRLVSDSELNKWLYEGQEESDGQKQKKKKKGNANPKQSNLAKYVEFNRALGEFGYRFVRAGNKLFASKTPYQNLVQLSEWQSYEFSDLVQQIPTLSKSGGKQRCDLCRDNPIVITDQQSKLQARLIRLQSTHIKGLGPSLGKFPNGFWNMNQSVKICFLCSFLIIHHHLAFTRLSDGSEIFINAPSFKLMFELNKLVKELYGASSAEETRGKREILAMSVIEYATRIRATLGIWAGMNLEIVSRKDDEINFFSLPSEVIQIISDREVAAQLSEIGEFKILNLVLNQEYSKLPELGYRLLRESLADQNKRNDKFINDWLYLWSNKGSNLRRTAEGILRLYALTEQKRQRSVSHGHTSIAAT